MYWIPREHTMSSSQVKRQRRSPPAPGSPAFEQLPAVSISFVIFFLTSHMHTYSVWRSVMLVLLCLKTLNNLLSSVSILQGTRCLMYVHHWNVYVCQQKQAQVRHRVSRCLWSYISIGEISPNRKRLRHSKKFRKIGVFICLFWSVHYSLRFVLSLFFLRFFVDFIYRLDLPLTDAGCRSRVSVVDIEDDGENDAPIVPSYVFPYFSSLFSSYGFPMLVAGHALSQLIIKTTVIVIFLPFLRKSSFISFVIIVVPTGPSFFTLQHPCRSVKQQTGF